MHGWLGAEATGGRHDANLGSEAFLVLLGLTEYGKKASVVQVTSRDCEVIVG